MDGRKGIEGPRKGPQRLDKKWKEWKGRSDRKPS